jgi:phosphate transport system permease protein
MDNLTNGGRTRDGQVHPSHAQPPEERSDVSEIAEAVEHEMPMVRQMRVRFHARPVADRTFVWVTMGLAAVILVLIFGMALALISQSRESLAAFGWRFIISTDWDPANDLYGALPFIYGTAVSSALALAIAVPLSLGVALCLSEMAPASLSRRLGFLVDLLAAIPSVVYGLWAVFVLGPWLRDVVEPPLSRFFGFIPLFSGTGASVSMFTAGVILAIMVIPYTSSVCTEVFRVVPQTQREAALALGATRWEMVRVAVLPYGLSGIVGAIILGLGRALGETIAVAMVIGNRPVIAASLFQPSSTLASVIANEFAEATSDLYVSALIELGLVLLVVGLVLNIAARLLVMGATQRQRA